MKTGLPADVLDMLYERARDTLSDSDLDRLLCLRAHASRELDGTAATLAWLVGNLGSANIPSDHTLEHMLLGMQGQLMMISTLLKIFEDIDNPAVGP